MSGDGMKLRQGLPRVAGGQPWPSGAVVPEIQVSVPSDAASVGPVASAPAASVASGVTAAASGVALRRGLPRVAGAEPWPPADATATVVMASEAPTVGSAVPEVQEVSASEVVTVGPAATTAVKPTGPREPLAWRRTVTPGKYAFTRPEPAPEPQRIGPFTKKQWAGVTVVGGFALLFGAAMVILMVRFLLSTAPFQDFIATYPGEYHLPEGAPVGIPAWLGWQHFFNIFLMALIIRSGLQVRFDQRPTAYWTGRGKNSKKVSLSAWFHQGLDLFWILNGVAFIILLFVTGQWMRIVPTSWEVFPNALSAVLQYASLDWPTENGWVNYNSVQQLAYFTTVFIAAPIAVITGFRMSGLWPSNAKFLNRIYPVECARKLHFPTMLYFVLFIFVHVTLVFATGALRNLNHMFAAQGSVDPSAYANNWTGFWIFACAMAVIAAAWVAARPMVLAPIAKLFGTVSAR